ncbi:MAG: tRNA lysidine(34) synthetase TilS [Candidatus Ancillula sp.]|nr:tRNA lysidine(34) synthetase TilS [Candidatus Ancillula sp.]
MTNRNNRRNKTFQKAFGEVYLSLKKRLINQKNKTIKINIGVSGGADSLALFLTSQKVLISKRWTEFCQKRNLAVEFKVITIDHGLQDSTKKVVQDVYQICKKFDVNCEIVNLNLDCKKNVEAVARDERYKVLLKDRPDILLLAHTLDDQAETVLLGLARGSKIEVLAGMQKERGAILRPFLELTRKETEEICRFFEIEYWDDPTNFPAANIYGYPARSRLRQFVFPELEKIFPGIKKNLVNVAKNIQEEKN